MVSTAHLADLFEWMERMEEIFMLWLCLLIVTIISIVINFFYHQRQPSPARFDNAQVILWFANCHCTLLSYTPHSSILLPSLNFFISSRMIIFLIFIAILYCHSFFHKGPYHSRWKTALHEKLIMIVPLRHKDLDLWYTSEVRRVKREIFMASELKKSSCPLICR